MHPQRIALVSYPTAMDSAVLGMADMLRVSGRFAEGEFEVSTLSAPSRTHYDCVVLPPSHEAFERSSAPWVVPWLREQHHAGAVLCSVCAGLLWLLDTGLVQGRSVTAHWGLATTLRDHPDATLDTDRLLIEHSDLITAGGMMSWVDLSLALIDRFLGREACIETARYFVVDVGRQSQRLYARFIPTLAHGDALIRKAQRRIESGIEHELTNATLAAESGMSLRNFLRRFKMATGFSPRDYVQQTRIDKARDLLIHTLHPVGEVARRVGYQNQSSFGRLFERISGASPAAFRRRYRFNA